MANVHPMVPSQEYIKEKSLEDLFKMSTFLLRMVGPQRTLPFWYSQGGYRQVDEEKVHMLNSVLLIWSQSQLPPPLRDELDEVEAHLEALSEFGGPVYAQLQ